MNNTEQIEARDARIKVLLNYQKLFELSLDMIGIANAEYFKEMSPAVEKILGYTQQEFLALPYLSLIHPDDLAATAAEVQKLTENVPTLYFENRYLCKDGSYKWLAWTSFPTDGLFYAIARDMTSQKKAEADRILLYQEKLARIEAEKGILLRDDFISIAAHELRTPLTVFSLQIQLLSKLLPEIESPKIQMFLGVVKNSKQQLDRLTNLVENLLDVSRASTGRLIIERTEVNLSEIINTVAKNSAAELVKSKCTLELRLDPSIIGQWDPLRIEQVLVNLLNNAMKFGAGKPIEIVATVKGNHARFEVRDQGIGISKKDQLRIFGRFERGTSIKNFAGLGLGLYITSQIVTVHGGNIGVESESDKGANFIVELPLELPPASLTEDRGT